MELSKSDVEWILEEIRQILASSHSIENVDRNEYERQSAVLEKGISPEVWNYDYSEDMKSEVKAMKSVWEKLRNKTDSGR